MELRSKTVKVYTSKSKIKRESLREFVNTNRDQKE